MRQFWPQPTINPCSTEGAEYGHDHDRDSVTDESEKRAGTCAGEGPPNSEDGAAGRVLNAATQWSAGYGDGLAVDGLET
jgi:hypothetical protein